MQNTIKDKNKSNIHHGHRQRVRDRITAAGFDSLPDHEFIEYVLFHAIPRRDVNPLAHELLDTFDGVHGLFNTNKQKFQTNTNLSDKTINFIIEYGNVVKQYMISRERD